MKKNFWLDIVLLISGAICIITGLVIDFHLFSGGKMMKILLTDIHRWTGYVMTAGIVLHVIWHWQWMKVVAKKMSADKD